MDAVISVIWYSGDGVGLEGDLRMKLHSRRGNICRRVIEDKKPRDHRENMSIRRR